MTVPPQPGSSSGSDSGQASTIAKDTITAGTTVTGLAGVLAADVAKNVADEIAKVVKPKIGNIGEVRVIGDLSALSDITTLRILESQVDDFTKQADDYVKPVPGAAPPGRKHHPTEEVTEQIAIGALVGAASAGIGLISQLVTGTYTYSGQAIPNSSVGGLDILIAKALSAELAEEPKPSTIPIVRVDRLAAMPADSQILAKIQDLAMRAAAGDLARAVIRAASASATAVQIVARDTEWLSKLEAALTAPTEKAPFNLGQLKDDRDQVYDRLPDESAKAAAAQNLLAEGQALVATISAFLTAAVSAPAAGGPAPVARAAHGEVLGNSDAAILYAQVIAAGDDQVLSQTFLVHDRWSNLTGVTAEYALMVPDGDVPVLGLREGFSLAHGSIRGGLDDIKRRKVTLRAEAEAKK